MPFIIRPILTFHFLDIKQNMEFSPYWACFLGMQSNFYTIRSSNNTPCNSHNPFSNSLVLQDFSTLTDSHIAFHSIIASYILATALVIFTYKKF